MKERQEFRKMLIFSVILHVIVVGVLIIAYTLYSPGELIAPLSEAQIVQLYDISELPDLPIQETQPPETESVVALNTQKPEEAVIFSNVSTIKESPTPTPQPTPTPTSAPLPTPTPKLVPTRRPTPRPTPRPIPTPTPEEAVASIEPPVRRPVIEPRPPEEIPSALRTPQATGVPSGTGTEGQTYSYSSRPSASLPMTFETESAFPYPEYLEHLKEKIEGLWFPQGSGTVSIYLIIDQNGKILKSGVDKGVGLGVEQLRESIVRALSLIKRFHSLPKEYPGTLLRVRITVRR